MVSQHHWEQPRQAIFLQNDGSLSMDTISTPYAPSETETLISMKYSGINPADIRHAHMGLYKTSSVTGYEWVGTVIKAGGKANFKEGQQVFGLSLPAFGGNARPLYSGAHQDYILAGSSSTWSVPQTLDLKQAAALPLGIQTAADAIFNIMGFAFDKAGLSGDSPSGKAILVWGGASSCGLAAIQIAKAAGFDPIFTTASARNHDTLKRLGASQCFDYRDEDVTHQIREAVKESRKPLATAFDAVAIGVGVFETSPVENLDLSKSTPALIRECLSNGPEDELRLSAVLPVSHDPLWRLCLGIRLQGSETLGIPQDPEWPSRLDAVIQWWLEDPSRFLHPNVTVASGIEKGMQQIQRVYDGKVSMEKVIIEHPWVE